MKWLRAIVRPFGRHEILDNNAMHGNVARVIPHIVICHAQRHASSSPRGVPCAERRGVPSPRASVQRPREKDVDAVAAPVTDTTPVIAIIAITFTPSARAITASTVAIPIIDAVIIPTVVHAIFTASATSTTASVADITGIAARLNPPSPLSSARGWPDPAWRPVLPATSSGGCSGLVDVAGGGVVVPPTIGEGVIGGGFHDEEATASTTTKVAVTTSAISVPTPTHSPSDPSSSAPAITIDNGGSGPDSDRSSLLQMAMAAGDNSISRCDCGSGPTSGEPLRARQPRGRTSPWPTVAMVEAAMHGACLPTGLADSLARTVRPRPAPASLLSALLCPQPEHSVQRGCRAGVALRVAKDDAAAAAASAGSQVARVIIQTISASASRTNE